MALDAGVVGPDVVLACGTQNVAARRMLGVLAAGTVAAFAANVPLDDLFGVDVVVDGMAAIAGGAGGSLHVVGRVERHPPIGSVGNKIGSPDVVGDVPLRGKREI